MTSIGKVQRQGKMKYESKNAQKLHLSRKFTYEKVNAYHKKFIDKKTGKFFSYLTKKRNCPVCENSKSTPIFDKSGGTYVKCNKCTMIFLNPVFKDDALEKYYQNLDVGHAVVLKNEAKFFDEIYTRGLNIISHSVKRGKILDIGCSSGFFLDIAKRDGWQTYGIELGKVEAEMCRKKGHMLYTKKLEDLNLDIKFDAITLWDVFEHLPNGKDQLKIFKKHLTPNGIIFLQIPNSDALAAKILREKCRMFDGIEHVNLYNPKTIKLAAQKTGLVINHLETVISEIAVLNCYLSYKDPYFGTSNYTDKILNILGEDFLHNNLLGYKMQILMS